MISPPAYPALSHGRGIPSYPPYWPAPASEQPFLAGGTHSDRVVGRHT